MVRQRRRRSTGLVRPRNAKGVILVTTLVVFSFMGALGMTLLIFVLVRDTFVSQEINRTQARYLAEAAVSRSVWELHNNVDPDGDGVGNVAERSFGAGEMKAQHDAQAKMITGIGEVSSMERVVQIQYSAL